MVKGEGGHGLLISWHILEYSIPPYLGARGPGFPFTVECFGSWYHVDSRVRNHGACWEGVKHLPALVACADQEPCTHPSLCGTEEETIEACRTEIGKQVQPFGDGWDWCPSFRCPSQVVLQQITFPFSKVSSSPLLVNQMFLEQTMPLAAWDQLCLL